ncbi:unnamed protein product [Cutaneotrichosporon oleaginosum]
MAVVPGAYAATSLASVTVVLRRDLCAVPESEVRRMTGVVPWVDAEVRAPRTSRDRARRTARHRAWTWRRGAGDNVGGEGRGRGQAGDSVSSPRPEWRHRADFPIAAAAAMGGYRTRLLQTALCWPPPRSNPGKTRALSCAKWRRADACRAERAERGRGTESGSWLSERDEDDGQRANGDGGGGEKVLVWAPR